MSPVPSPAHDAREQHGEQAVKESSSAADLLSPEMMAIIHGSDDKDKKAEYEASLKRWWTEYADRKNDEDDEYVANSLLYDRNHLPRTAPAPDCCKEEAAGKSN